MPTKRIRRSQPSRAQLTPGLIEILLTGEHGEGCSLDGLRLARDDNELRAVWAEHRGEVLGDFIRGHPGQRPYAWWRLEAPEPRRRLGGIGTAAHEVLAYAPEFHAGIPANWVTAWDVRYYNGRARDVNGRPIGTEYHAGDFRAEALDATDPPTFESQASYLRRLKLLGEEERRRLPREAFAPEIVTVDEPTLEELTAERGRTIT